MLKQEIARRPVHESINRPEIQKHKACVGGQIRRLWRSRCETVLRYELCRSQFYIQRKGTASQHVFKTLLRCVTYDVHYFPFDFELAAIIKKRRSPSQLD
jgi:hypothetical protein